MNLVYKNFKIECEDKSIMLYFIDKEKEKLIGYYSTIYLAIKGIYLKLLGDKKKKNDPDMELLSLLQKYRQLDKRLEYLSEYIYKPIHKLDIMVNGIRKI